MILCEDVEINDQKVTWCGRWWHMREKMMMQEKEEG